MAYTLTGVNRAKLQVTWSDGDENTQKTYDCLAEAGNYGSNGNDNSKVSAFVQALTQLTTNSYIESSVVATGPVVLE